MASSGNLYLVVLIFLFACMHLLPQSGGEHQLSRSGNMVRQKEMVLGSRPPGCVNKCLSCRPCMATLIIPSHQKRDSVKEVKPSTPSFHVQNQNQDDDSYYYLFWKCKCGDKFFHP